MAGKKVIILTGEIQSGKTTTLLSWIKEKNDVAGILTPVKNGKRFFYSIPNKTFYAMEAGDGEEYLKVGRFKFSSEQFRKTNEAVLKWLQEPQWKWLIIDEIGPLELKQQKGFWPSFNHILNGAFTPSVIIVVRQSLSETVTNMLKERSLEVITCSANEFQLFVN
jgi:nucleoside-triphosphatase THEP1